MYTEDRLQAASRKEKLYFLIQQAKSYHGDGLQTLSEMRKQQYVSFEVSFLLTINNQCSESTVGT
jgi:hypothetical protein